MIFTFGYRGQRVPDIDWFTKQFDAILVDIRMSAKSVRPEWNGPALKTVLADRYIHLPALGNKNYANGGPIDIADIDAGLRSVVGHSQDLVLMCGCRDRFGCHRDVVADVITDRYDVDIPELRFTWAKAAPSKCPICDARLGFTPEINERTDITCGHAFIWRPKEVS